MNSSAAAMEFLHTTFAVLWITTFLMIFTAYQCKVHRVVVRCAHSWLLYVGKSYAWVIKCPEVPYIEYPWYVHVVVQVVKLYC